MSVFGATTVRSSGVANFVAFAKWLIGALPRPSGQGTLVISWRIRSMSSSGKP